MEVLEGEKDYDLAKINKQNKEIQQVTEGKEFEVGRLQEE
jgi:hypothetical protein